MPIYYINVIHTEEKEYLIKILDTPNEYAIGEIKCETEDDVKTTVQLLHDILASKGTVISDERMKEIERILLMHPFYVEKRSWSRG